MALDELFELLESQLVSGFVATVVLTVFLHCVVGEVDVEIRVKLVLVG